jgi:dihydroorotate dehydrogenase electron transfer subunit
VFRARRTLDVLYDVVGEGTRTLASVRKGDTLDVLGPLGNAFTWPGAHVREVVMVAGGIGIAPFMLLTDQLKKFNGRKVLLFGGKSGDHVFDLKPFKDNGCEAHVVTEDGSAGEKGLVTKLFSLITRDPEGTFVYTCGPKAMMAAVQEFAGRHKLAGEASAEEVMACGLGACLGCAVRTKSGYKTACYDGPVFGLQDMIFDPVKGGKKR